MANRTDTLDPTTADQPTRAVLQSLVSMLFQLPAMANGLSSMEAMLEKIRASQDGLRTQLDELKEAVYRMEQACAVLSQKQECLELASREQVMLSEQHYQEHVLIPFAHHVMQVYRSATEVLRRFQVAPTAGGEKGAPDDGRGSHQTPPARLEDSTRQVLSAVQSQIGELIAVYGIDLLNQPPGAPFDRRTMRPLDAPSGAAGQAFVVAESVSVGLCMGERVLFPQVVKVRPVAGEHKA